MVLKRYEADRPPRSSEGATSSPRPTNTGVGGGGTKKSQRKVVVPHRLDCSKFMVPMGGKVSENAPGDVGKPPPERGNKVVLHQMTKSSRI